VSFFVVASSAAPATAAAQASVELGPLVAAYAPLGSFRAGGYGSTALPTKPSDLGGPAWGAQGRFWLNPRVGVQLQVALARSRFGGGVFTPAGFVTTPQDAQVVTVSAQVLYRPLRSKFPLVVSAGAGVVRHGGEAYSWPAFRGLSPVAVAIGLGCDLHLGRWLTATPGVTTLLYSLDVHDDFRQHYERGFQVDLLPHVSLALRSRRR
jgi:hypothetical protein